MYIVQTFFLHFYMTSPNQRQRPQKQIHLRRRFYKSKDIVYYAVLYLEKHPDLGHINDTLLNLLQHFYSPLGIKEFGDFNESLQVAMQSIAVLEGHVNYLKAVFGLTSSGSNTISPTLPPQATQAKPNDSLHSYPENKEDTELAVAFFDSFNQD